MPVIHHTFLTQKKISKGQCVLQDYLETSFNVTKRVVKSITTCTIRISAKVAAIQAKANYDKHDINKANRQVLVSSLVMTEDLKKNRHNPQPDTVFMYWKSHKLIETDGNGLDWRLMGLGRK